MYDIYITTICDITSRFLAKLKEGNKKSKLQNKRKIIKD